MNRHLALHTAAILALSAAVLLCAGSAAAEPMSASTVPMVTQEPFNVTGSLIRMLGGLFLCVGLFGAAIHVYKRYVLKGRVGTGRRLSVVERVPVSSKGSLLLLSLDGREFVVATGSDAPRIVSVPGDRKDNFAASLEEAFGEEESFNA